MTPNDLEVVRRQAGLTVDAQRISNMLKAPMIKLRLSDRLDLESAAEVTPQMLFQELKSSGGAEWFLEEIERTRRRIREDVDDEQKREEIPQEELIRLEASRSFVMEFDMPAQRVQEVASDRVAARKLAAVEAKVLQTAGAGWMGFSARTISLISVSVIVCIVGVVNAMLMSVAERFREIATMKCLGATDGFIMINFMLESCVQGIAGGVIGSILGLILGTLRSWAMYGGLALSHMPFLEIAMAAVTAFTLGVVLSVMAAVYPALVAARLAPMEAMRIE